MTPLQAAFRLYTSTPREKVRTHTWDGIEEGAAGRRRTPGEKVRLKEELQRSRAAGMTIRQMCKEHQCTVKTIRNLLGPLKREIWAMTDEHKQKCAAALSAYRAKRKTKQ